jgi:methyl-accepting chemotaxis protein
VIRELVTLPVSIARAAIELPRSMQRSIDEANDLMEVSREQLEVMRRQADQALEQAERMNELLGRVVKLTEPLERAQRGGEYVAGELKKAIFGAEEAVEQAQEAAIEAEAAVEEAEEAAEQAEEMRGGPGGEAEEPPVSGSR